MNKRIYNNIFISTILIFCLFLEVCHSSLCHKHKDKDKDINNITTDITGEYEDSSGYITVNIWKDEKKQINGSHCFVLQGGNRIDCSDSASIKLYTINNNKYSGFFCSNYDNEKYNITFVIDYELKISMFIEEYPFISDTIKLRKKI